MPLNFEITVDDKGNAAIKQLGQSTQQLQGKVAGLGTTFKAVFGGIITVAAIRKISGAMIDLAKAADAQAKADRQLINAMKERGQYTQTNLRLYKQFAEATMLKVGIDDAEIQATQRQLVQFGVYGDLVNKATQAVLDYSAAKGVDLQSATNTIVRSLQSESGAIKGLTSRLDGSAGSAERLGAILDVIDGKFKGTAESSASELDKIKMQFDELKEDLGETFLPIVIKIGNKAVGFFEKAQDWYENSGFKEVVKTAGTGGKGEALAQWRFVHGYTKGGVSMNDLHTLEGAGPSNKGGVGNPPPSANEGSIYKNGFSPAQQWEVQYGARLKAEEELAKLEDEAFAKQLERFYAEMDLAWQATKAKLEFTKQLDKADEEYYARQRALQEANLAGTVHNFLAVADMFKEHNAGMFGMAKGLAMAEATINAYQSITKTLATGGALAIPLAISTGALAFAQVAQIAATDMKGFAQGTAAAPGGVAVVGERGPELAYIPRGTRVIPNPEVQRMSSAAGGTTVVIQVNGNGDSAWVRNTLLPTIRREMRRV